MNKNNNCGVYIITCQSNGKIYIGSSIELDERKYFHFSKHQHNQHLFRAMNKYGHENFTWDVLEYCEEYIVRQREQYYLDTLLFAQEYIKSNGKDKRFLLLSYNKNPTVSSSLGWHPTEEQRKANSESKKLMWQKQDYIDKQNKIRTPEWHANRIAKMLETKNGPQKEEIRKKMSQSIKNSNYHKSLRKPILVYDRFSGNFIQEFLSLSEVCKLLNIEKQRVQKNIKNKIKFTSNYIFRYKTSDDYPKQIEPITTYYKSEQALDNVKNIGKKNSKPILCYDLNDKFIKEFPNAVEAAKELKILDSGIRLVLHGKCKQTKGYKFTYKEGYEKKTYNKQKFVE